ncbi:MAG: pitrilysin family protein [bacterium]|nr:pitrilysin family protein [bacterium]
MNYQLSEFGVSFSKNRLDNGVNVFLFNKIGIPICVRASFFAGSRFDSILGIAHFLEHVLVAGTKKFPSKDKLAEPLERVGGSFSASTGHDDIRFNITIPRKEDLNIGLEILKEMLWHSNFDDKTIENERGAIVSEIGEDEEDPYWILNDIYYHIIFRDTPLENNVIGNKDSVKKINKQDLLKYKDTFLNTGRMSILVSGDVTMNECLPLLNKHLDNYKTEKRFNIPPKAATHRDSYITYEPFKDNKQIYAKIGFRTIGINENDREILSLDLIAGILGKGRASRLAKELRYKRGLVYSANAGHYNYPDAGHFSISTSFEHNKMENVIEIIISELKKIGQDGISEYEFEFVKSAAVKSVFNAMQTSWSWINVHEDEMVLNPELARTVEYFMNEINSLTLEEVNAIARKYLHKDNFYLALCGTDKEPTVLW